MAYISLHAILCFSALWRCYQHDILYQYWLRQSIWYTMPVKVTIRPHRMLVVPPELAFMPATVALVSYFGDKFKWFLVIIWLHQPTVPHFWASRSGSIYHQASTSAKDGDMISFMDIYYSLVPLSFTRAIMPRHSSMAWFWSPSLLHGIPFDITSRHYYNPLALLMPIYAALI